MSKANNLPAFTEHERRLIVNCRDYAQNDPAGLPGHDLMMIIAKLFNLSIGHELDMNTQKEEVELEWKQNQDTGILYYLKGGKILARIEQDMNEWHYSIYEYSHTSPDYGVAMNEHDAKVCVEMILDGKNT